MESDLLINFWNQPESFLSDEKTTGGFINFESRYVVNQQLSLFLGIDGKTKGWMIDEPDLKSNYSVQAGFKFNLTERRNQ
ncbi:MAG TPA: hypothetical protein VK172_05085 [Lentimicrobium sp.]|nr:hypothetical protein [Lentimicrobium sp.]